MEKQIIEILARLPEISQLGMAYIDYLRLKMLLGFAFGAVIFSGAVVFACWLSKK